MARAKWILLYKSSLSDPQPNRPVAPPSVKKVFKEKIAEDKSRAGKRTLAKLRTKLFNGSLDPTAATIGLLDCMLRVKRAPYAELAGSA